MIPVQIRNVAETVAEAIDYPDWILISIGDNLMKFGGPIYKGFESLCITLAPEYVKMSRDWADKNVDPYIKTLPMSDPVTVAFWCTFYLVAISLLYPIGRFVSHPGKLQLRRFSMCHNFFLTILSLYMGVAIFSNAIASNYSLFNNYSDPKDKRFSRACWLFCCSKLYDFVDTFIMCLKGNTHQISLLHVYHHVSIVVFVYFFACSSPSGDSYLSSAMNSMPNHFTMYLYYFLTAFAGKTGPLRAFLNSMKFMITKGQLLQFCINLTHAFYMLWWISPSDAKFPLHKMKVMLAYMITMIVLFADFMYRGMRDAAIEQKKRYFEKYGYVLSSTGEIIGEIKSGRETRKTK